MRGIGTADDVAPYQNEKLNEVQNCPESFVEPQTIEVFKNLVT